MSHSVKVFNTPETTFMGEVTCFKRRLVADEGPAAFYALYTGDLAVDRETFNQLTHAFGYTDEDRSHA